ncbi:hypothetical protein I5Q34_25470 [Streptomyces sp. AV19]|uniref:hypothetical protein n=1 Tax=Streptomyces sp. AV19 TaxID=2793068 RepID=UPI0018FE92CC|nr:hypothetical protein [Streptomyces sp. AV19]MBH1937580.1 hypothetical protein [Streptomyces sp. AV19]MDG4533595.1 hypothetical protein [Streptomyces sp. AV19]
MPTEQQAPAGRPPPVIKDGAPAGGGDIIPGPEQDSGRRSWPRGHVLGQRAHVYEGL